MDAFTKALLSAQPILKSGTATEFRQLLSGTLNDHLITMPSFGNQLRKLTVTISEPAGMSLHDALELELDSSIIFLLLFRAVAVDALIN